MSETTIAEFWSWWREAAPRFASAFDEDRPLTHDEIEEITSRVHSVQDGLVWEFGPGRLARHALTLSPEGNIVLRRLTERLVRAAPPPDGVWEYYPARQPVPDFSLSIAGQHFDADEWRFDVEVDEGRLVVNLDAFHPKLRKVPKDARPQAGFIAVDQMFGEDTVETWIGVLSFTDRDKHTKATAADVRAVIEGLAEQSKEEVFSLAQGVAPDGRPLILAFNQRLKRLHRLLADTLVEVDFALQAPDDNGFPSGDELHDLNAIEDRLLTVANDAVHVGHMTGRGHRTTYFYTADALGLGEWLNAALRDRGAPYDLRSRHDPEWTFYREGMFEQFAPR